MERGAFALLGAWVAAPLVTLLLAWLFQLRLTPDVVAGTAAAVALAAAASWWGRREQKPLRPITRSHIAVLGGAAFVGLVTAWSHSDAELLLAMASWLERGEAECFYMQSFVLVDELQGPRHSLSVRDAWSIISVPTNTALTAPLLPIFDDRTFRVADVLARSLTFCLLAALLLRRRVHLAAALSVAGFALLNPYMLGVEVLDRNVLAAMFSGALLLALQTAPGATLLHGALLGLTAGAGLRFLPVVFVVPVLLHHFALRSGGQGGRRLGWLAIGFLATIAVGLPHLFQHGLHSLGETKSLFELVWLTLTEMPRAPFAPFAAGPLHVLETASRLGLLVVGAVLGGAWLVFQSDRTRALGLLIPILVVFGVLGAQRDWTQWDKLRIPLMLLIPSALLLGEWVHQFACEPTRRRALLAGGLGLLVASVGSAMFQALETPADPTAGARHPVYATETQARLGPARAALRPRLLPNYGRLGTKADPARKRRQSRALRSSLFPEEGPSSELLRAAGWAMGGGETVAIELGPTLDIAVDLERLLAAPDEAVSVVSGEEVWLDATASGLLDVVHRAVRVSWQPEELNVTALPLAEESQALGEVVIELDAFTGDGLDGQGLRRVVPIHRVGGGDRTGAFFAAVPDLSTDSRLVLRVGENQAIRIRQWLVDGRSGTPHRVDSWFVQPTKSGVSVRYSLGEPESYL